MATVSCAAATVWSAMLWMFMSWPLTENVCSSLAWRNCGNLISLVNDWFENEHKTLILGNEESEVWWGFWERFLGLYRKYRREDKEASSSFVVATPGWEGWYPVSHLVSIKPQAWRWEWAEDYGVLTGTGLFSIGILNLQMITRPHSAFVLHVIFDHVFI